MAQPANTFDSYDMTGIIDDLVNQILAFSRQKAVIFTRDDDGVGHCNV